ncbi:uncharacterized protein LOC109818567 isoform X2 [Cajanus cajan]|uniref:uncharacterized protein LOC109818567 isoform X2 n=1 Tax=Cajanus cajan TaxID=3821 RepID=UPI00098D9212|nr:uncharacterized protein LOC109818567 isoform X2 [Cajanus cajan]
MAPKRKRPMADKNLNKGKASLSHPTVQLARHLAQMTSQIPPSSSSHAISRPADPPAWTSDVIPPPSMEGVHSPCTSQPTNLDAGRTLDRAPENRSAIRRKFGRQQTADKDQIKGKASESHPSMQHSRRSAQMTSQIPQCASSHAISRPTDPAARISDVIPPPSVDGIHSPCISQRTNPYAGHTFDMAPKKRSGVRRKMADKDHNKGKAFKSYPTKQRTTHLAQKASQNPPCASQPTNSMEGAHSPARTSNETPPPSVEGAHSPRTSQPINSDGGRTRRSFTALETQINDGKPILYLDGQGFLPSRPAANGIGDIVKSYFTDPWPSWKKIPSGTRDLWFEEFMGKYSVFPPDYHWAKKNFEMRGTIFLKNNLNKARTTMNKPDWIKDGVWERLCEHWSSEGFKKKSIQAKTNRASNCGASHTGGSITTSQHRANMMKETGTLPTPLELFRRMHQHKDNTWVDRRSQHLNEVFTRTLKQLTKRALAQGKPPPSESDVWCDVARSKKGKIYGLGMQPKIMALSPCYHGSSSSSTEWVKKQEFDELRKEMEEVRNERDKLEARFANTERLLEHNNALIRELMESNEHARYYRGKSR